MAVFSNILLPLGVRMMIISMGILGHHIRDDATNLARRLGKITNDCVPSIGAWVRLLVVHRNLAWLMRHPLLLMRC